VVGDKITDRCAPRCHGGAGQ